DASGDYLPQFHHSSVARGLVVGKRHSRIVQEQHHRFLVLLEAQQEIMAGTPSDPAAFDVARQGWERLVPGETRADNAVIKPLGGGAGSGGTQRTCLVGWALSGQIDLMAQAAKQGAHAPRPGLA